MRASLQILLLACVIAAALSGCRATEPPVPGPVTFTAITTGYHTCALSADSSAYCWGRNSDGQLGHGTTTHQPAPLRVPSNEKFVLISAGEHHTCAISASSVAYCWGANTLGQIGDGTVEHRPSPVPVAGNIAFAQLAAGYNHTCGIDTSGDAWCWGGNSTGQLGDATLNGRLAPVRVAGSVRYSAITSGAGHTCAVATDGAAWCWGHNVSGEVGDSTLVQRSTPTPAVGGLRFTSLAAGRHFTCGIATDETTFCWGSNSSSVLGDGQPCDPRAPHYPCALRHRAYPGPIGGSHRARAVAAGYSNACIVATDGAAFCWGYNAGGTVGTGGASMYVRLPAGVAGGLTFTTIAVGVPHVCAVATDGTAYCWGGTGQYGELGTGDPQAWSYAPVAVSMPSPP